LQAKTVNLQDLEN
jgi:hypothetical protein